ncbi:E2-like conjugating enzyme atg10 [Geranomyces variabilis]|uniref:Ubiquitin-like-conjugating enzyme ATG10 n=1 Tax=Geranomyces variabilis TaxID=109894 RepID=A0AAD5TD47_9FUNG|nr:E2-like conjugating enzyme atg10 [Geranomyces variabilis]
MVEQTAAVGTLSQQQFTCEAASLVEKAKALGEPWTLVEAADQPAYLKRLVSVRSAVRPATDELPVSDGVVDVEEEPNDGATLHSDPLSEITLEVHAIYSKTWQCPVLYFSAWSANTGTPVSLDGLKNAVRDGLPDLDLTARTAYHMPFIAQQDHPVLGTPFYSIHPCETAMLMAEMLSNTDAADGRYLLLWLSLVGTIFHPIALVHSSYFN